MINYCHIFNLLSYNQEQRLKKYIYIFPIIQLYLRKEIIALLCTNIFAKFSPR